MGASVNHEKGSNSGVVEGTAGSADAVAGHSPFQQELSTSNGMESAPQRSDEPAGGRASNVCIMVISAIYAVGIVFAILTTPDPLFTLLFVVLAVLPAGLIGKFIRSHLHDDAIPTGFLKTQFLVAAIPLTIGVILVELVVLVIFALVLLNRNLGDISQALKGMDQSSESEEAMLQLIKLVPIWKWVLFCIGVAFLVAAVVEEGAKWMLARRYLKVNDLTENVLSGRRITVRGILAIASTAALGLATVENLNYVLGLSRYPTKSVFPFRRVGLTVLRDLLAFPVHVGATFYIALAAAQRAVLEDGPGVLGSFFVAVFFHGCFDGIALIAGLLVMIKVLPGWVEYLVIVGQFVLVIGLMVLCHGRFSSLIERERAVVVDGVQTMV